MNFPVLKQSKKELKRFKKSVKDTKAILKTLVDTEELLNQLNKQYGKSSHSHMLIKDAIEQINNNLVWRQTQIDNLADQIAKLIC